MKSGPREGTAVLANSLRGLGERPVFFPPLAKGGQGGGSGATNCRVFEGYSSASLFAARRDDLEIQPRALKRRVRNRF